MTSNGDLRTAKVFPVTHPDDGLVWVGLRELLVRAHEFTDLAVTVPPAEVGMLRVLYTIAARVTGLDTVPDGASVPQAWNRRRRAVLGEGRFDPDAVRAYLAAHDGRWDLFDPVRPWWQDPRLAEQAEAKSVNVLDPTRPGDNSPVWWQHTHAGHAPPIPVAEALQWLLVHHYYGSGGTGGTRRVGTIASQHMSAGPLRAALVFSPLAPTLFQTLIAGIPRPNDLDLQVPDTAPWETPGLNDPLEDPPPVSWPAGVLTGRSRHALLLVPDENRAHAVGCYLTWGWKPRHLPHPDPYTIIDAGTGGEWKHRQADSARALWREVDALLGDRPDSQRPDVLTSALSLPDAMHDTLLVRVHGFDQDPKTVNRAWFTAVTPPLLAWMRENDDGTHAEGAASLHQAAEDIADVMNSALRKAYRSLATGKPGNDKGKAVPWVAPAATCYWPAAETLFWDKIHAADFDQPYQWFARLALDAVTAATRPQAHHPEVAREIAAAQRYLLNFAKKKNPRPPAREEPPHAQ